MSVGKIKVQERVLSAYFLARLPKKCNYEIAEFKKTPRRPYPILQLEPKSKDEMGNFVEFLTFLMSEYPRMDVEVYSTTKFTPTYVLYFMKHGLPKYWRFFIRRGVLHFRCNFDSIRHDSWLHEGYKRICDKIEYMFHKV